MLVAYASSGETFAASGALVGTIATVTLCMALDIAGESVLGRFMHTSGTADPAAEDLGFGAMGRFEVFMRVVTQS